MSPWHRASSLLDRRHGSLIDEYKCLENSHSDIRKAALDGPLHHTMSERLFPWPCFSSHDTDSIYTDDLKYIWLSRLRTPHSHCASYRGLWKPSRPFA